MPTAKAAYIDSIPCSPRCVVLALALASKSKFSGTTLCYLQQFSEHIAAESVAIAGDLEDALSKITIQPAAASHE